MGGALAPKAAVQVAPDGDVAAIPRKLADVIDVGDHIRQPDSLGALPMPPPGHDHPTIHGDADPPIALYDRANLVVGELALVRHQRPAVGMAGDDPAGELG